MEDSGLSGIVRYVFHDRQQLGCLRVRDGVIVLENMYFADEIRPAKGIAPKGRRVPKQELEMAEMLIDRITTSFDHKKYRDEYTDRLLEIVKRKRKGEEVHAAAEREEQEAPADLLEALRASVDSAKSRSKPRSRSKSRNGRSRSKPSRRPRSRSRSRS